jgi:succinate dehydrogenase / fumarate reductase, iron-sulfur subunit
MPDTVTVEVIRQDSPDSRSYVETFRLPYKPGMNVITVLQEIAANPILVDGRKTKPVAWDCNCLEEVCGACSMVINGRVRQACTALIDQLLEDRPDRIALRPMTRFPVIRDLIVDRSRMFEALKRVQAWIPVDGYHHIGPGPLMSPEVQEEAYPLSRCMSCGCCLEACPQINPRSSFVGAAAISQVVLFNLHPTGKLNAGDRLATLFGPGGIAECGNAQNCVKVCPKHIPLTVSIAKAGRETTFYAIKRWLSK